MIFIKLLKTRKHFKTSAVLLLLSALLIFSVVSCNQSDIGIFYGIEKEEKIVDRSLNNSLTIGAMDKLGSTLYIAAGKVYRKASGTNNDWVKCSTPSGYDLSTSLTVFNSNIYAVWFNKDTAATALFRSADGNSWTQVSDSDFTGDFSLVRSANSIMVVSTVTDSQSNTGNYYTTSTGADNSYAKIDLNALGGHFDIDYDGVGAYWFLIPENIYEVADIGTLNALTAASGASLSKLDEDEYFNNLYAYDTTHVYVNRSYGKFSFFNGSSWTTTIEDITPNVNDMIVFAVNSTPTFFVGTYYQGYYEPTSPGLTISDLEDPESDSITCDYQTYNASDLDDAAVLGFFKDDLTGDGDTADDELYALTYGRGLWKNIDDSSSRKWERE